MSKDKWSNVALDVSSTYKICLTGEVLLKLLLFISLPHDIVSTSLNQIIQVMGREDDGSIILAASVNASTGFEATSVYSGTKAAVRSFARCWTVDLKHRKIRVNAISPGPIDTPMTRSMVKGESGEQLKNKLLSTMPWKGGWAIQMKSQKQSCF